jgi:hypothetical protein
MTVARHYASRQKFSPGEDETIRQLVSVHQGDWQAIADELGNRGARQCKERWKHYLSPALIHEPWDRHEDDMLEQKVREMGKRWKVLEQFFPGRTDVSLKNRYNLLVRKKNKALKIALHLPLKTSRKREDLIVENHERLEPIEDQRQEQSTEFPEFNPAFDYCWGFEFEPDFSFGRQ